MIGSRRTLAAPSRAAVPSQTGGRHGPAAPTPHPSGARPPALAAEAVPAHVALVMDGNGRWARSRGLPRTEGHKRGEAALFDVVEGAIELGVSHLSAYAFSTENWKRSPDEVRFLMGFNRDVIRRRRDSMHELGVRVRWAGRRPRLWRSVISELEEAERMTAGNSVLTLTMCVNYGGRAEIADAARAIAVDAAAGRLRPDKVDERTVARYLDEPDMPDVDLFLRSSGEQRTSNFLLWQSAYAELVFLDTLFPDFDRRDLWRACEIYAARTRRFGGVLPAGADAPNDAGGGAGPTVDPQEADRMEPPTEARSAGSTEPAGPAEPTAAAGPIRSAPSAGSALSAGAAKSLGPAGPTATTTEPARPAGRMQA